MSGIYPNIVSNAENVTIDAFTGQLGIAPLASVVVAYLSANQANVTGAAANYPIIFDATEINFGSAYNTATGQFTAVSNGTYLFLVQVTYSNLTLANTNAVIQIVNTSGISPQIVAAYNVGAINSGGYGTLNGQTMIPMTAGDTIYVTAQSSGGAGNTVGIFGSGTAATTTTLCISKVG